jgi:small subunit ribosomal protein S6
MPIELYETMFLFDSTKLSADGDAVRGQVVATLERYGATLEVNRPWDDRKLAYPINKQKKGVYHIIYYRMESTKQSELDRDLRLNENLLRYMTIHVDAKWSEAMLEVAKNDQGAAFALRGMQEDSGSDMQPNYGDGFDGPPMDGPPRRGRRDQMAEKPE